MVTDAAQLPPNAPYEIVMGDPVEVKVEKNDAGWIVAEIEFHGDTFGHALDPADYESDLELEIAIDALVTWGAELVWNELGGTPVFREEDAGFTGRVEVQRSWEKAARKPTAGLIANPEVIPQSEAEPVAIESLEQFRETYGESGASDEFTGVAMNDAEAGEEVEVALGVKPEDLVDLSLTPDDLVALSQGQIPEAVTGRIYRRMTPQLLLGIAEKSLTELLGETDDDDDRAAADRGFRAVRELRRRMEG